MTKKDHQKFCGVKTGFKFLDADYQPFCAVINSPYKKLICSGRAVRRRHCVGGGGAPVNFGRRRRRAAGPKKSAAAAKNSFF